MMLAAFFACSVPFLALMWVLATASPSRTVALTQPLARFRLTLGLCAVIIAVVAIDLTAVRISGDESRMIALVSIGDGAVILAAIVALSTGKRSILDLWIVAATAGILVCMAFGPVEVVTMFAPPMTDWD